MTALELKPCPFCGGEAITSPSVVDRQVLYAHCKDHTCPGWTVSRCPHVRWNRRADLAAVQPAQVRDVCSKCFGTGMRIGDNGDPSLCYHCHGDTLEPQPDPRDEVIARLVGALELFSKMEFFVESSDDTDPCIISAGTVRRCRAALAAAKAVQK